MSDDESSAGKWEVSIIELENHITRFKVTRRMPEMSVAETKIFDTKEEAKKQLDEWLE
jgi:hypothetical protein